MTMQLDKSWKHKVGPIYYQHSKRKWKCVNCEYETKSPNGANSHAAEHGLKLPARRKKEKPEKKPEIQAQIKPKKEEKFNTHTLQPLHKTVEKPHFSPKVEPENHMSLEMRYKLEMAKGIQALQMTGVVPQEEIDRLRIQYGLKEKPQPQPDYSMMMYLMMQNHQTPRELSFSDIFYNALEKVTLEKMKQEEFKKEDLAQ